MVLDREETSVLLESSPQRRRLPRGTAPKTEPPASALPSPSAPRQPGPRPATRFKPRGSAPRRSCVGSLFRDSPSWSLGQWVLSRFHSPSLRPTARLEAPQQWNCNAKERDILSSATEGNLSFFGSVECAPSRTLGFWRWHYTHSKLRNSARADMSSKRTPLWLRVPLPVSVLIHQGAYWLNKNQKGSINQRVSQTPSTEPSAELQLSTRVTSIEMATHAWSPGLQWSDNVLTFLIRETCQRNHKTFPKMIWWSNDAWLVLVSSVFGFRSLCCSWHTNMISRQRNEVCTTQATQNEAWSLDLRVREPRRTGAGFCESLTSIVVITNCLLCWNGLVGLALWPVGSKDTTNLVENWRLHKLNAKTNTTRRFVLDNFVLSFKTRCTPVCRQNSDVDHGVLRCPCSCFVNWELTTELGLRKRLKMTKGQICFRSFVLPWLIRNLFNLLLGIKQISRYEVVSKNTGTQHRDSAQTFRSGQ